MVLLRRLGYTAGIVEKRIPFGRVTVDFLGCIDIVAVNPAARSGCLGVQATSGSGGHHASRRAKAAAEPRLRPWLEAGNTFEVWSWRKAGARGERKRWQVRREAVTLVDLAGGPRPRRSATSAAPRPPGRSK